MIPTLAEKSIKYNLEQRSETRGIKSNKPDEEQHNHKQLKHTKETRGFNVETLAEKPPGERLALGEKNPLKNKHEVQPDTFFFLQL